MSLDIEKIFQKYKLGHHKSPTKLIQAIGDIITESRTELKVSNMMIRDFGGDPVLNPGESRIIAKTYFEHALRDGSAFDLELANKAAKERIIKLRRSFSCLFLDNLDENGNPPERKQREQDPEVVARKNAAEKIYNANKEKTATEIAKLIEAELNITFANAYYYVSRVFKEKSNDEVKLKTKVSKPIKMAKIEKVKPTKIKRAPKKK